MLLIWPQVSFVISQFPAIFKFKKPLKNASFLLIESNVYSISSIPFKCVDGLMFYIVNMSYKLFSSFNPFYVP